MSTGSRRTRALLAPVGVLAAALLLAGCLSERPGTREVIGSLAGAAGGAAAAANNVGKGSGRTLAIAAGTLLGGAIGADIGRSLDRANAAYETAPARRRGHSQQVPVAGIDPPAGYARSAARSGGAGYSIREARDCRPLEDGGLRPVFACTNDAGQWFILQ